MKLLVLAITLALSVITSAQTYLVDEHFDPTAPSGWSSTSNVWNFARNETATGNYRSVFDATTYSARFSSAANGNSIYIYIPINFVSGNTYTITFYTKRVCSVVVNTNELPNQTTLLTTDASSNAACNSNWNTWYQWSFSIPSTYTGSGYFQIWTKTIYGGPTSVYLDDLSIFESPAISLPIELTEFTASPVTRGVDVKWTCASETNTSHFIIERTTFPIDWIAVNQQPAAGNSSHTTHYSYIDATAPLDITYYQLTQVDLDGKQKTYSPISVDNRRELAPFTSFTILGTPTPQDHKGLVIHVFPNGKREIHYQD